MKKFLLMSLALMFVLALAGPTNAGDVNFGIEYRARGIYKANVLDLDNDTKSDEVAYMDSRFRLSADAKSDRISGKVVLDLLNSGGSSAAGPMGSGDTVADPDDVGNYVLGTSANSSGGSQNVIGFHEAFLTLDLDMADVSVGRQDVQLGNGIVLADTHDALVIGLPAGDMADITLGALKVSENSPPNSADTDVYIVNAGLKPGEGLGLDLFAGYQDVRSSTHPTAATPGSTHAYFFGAAFGGKLGPVDVTAEGDYLNGSYEDNNVSSNDFDISGYNLYVKGGLDLGQADVALGILYTSGQDPDDEDRNQNFITEDFTIANIITDELPNNPGNLTAIQVTGGLNPAEAVSLNGAVTYAMFTEAPGKRTDGDEMDKQLGVEIDVNGAYSVTENTTVGLDIGVLLPGDGAKDLWGNESNDDSVWEAILGVSYKK